MFPTSISISYTRLNILIIRWEEFFVKPIIIIIPLFAVISCVEQRRSFIPAFTQARLDAIHDSLKTIPIEAQITNYNRVDAEYIGFGAIRSAQYKRYLELKLLPDTTLLRLSKSKSPVLKAYVFKALAEKKSALIFDVLEANLNVKTKIETLTGCFGQSIPLNIYCYGMIHQYLNSEQKLTCLRELKQHFSDKELKLYLSAY